MRTFSLFLLWTVVFCAVSFSANAQTTKKDLKKTEYLFFITFDGMRWQELYTGADSSFFGDDQYVADSTKMMTSFWHPDSVERRRLLMPFFWNTIAKEGQLYGYRPSGNFVNCRNPHWFSYPGYNEMLTGYADASVNSNDKIYNRNVTVLEHLNRLPAFAGKVAAFASWDVFPYIINDQRSGVPVQAGFASAAGKNLTDKELMLNELQVIVPSPWSSVRLDAFTHGYAVEYLKKRQPKVIYIGYGETDDFAHDGNYQAYLTSANRTDGFIRQLWEYVQKNEPYKGRTTFVISTDHGRGYQSKAAWKDHDSEIVGSDEIWFAVIGPDTPANGVMLQKGQWYQNQIAATLADFLGVLFNTNPEMGAIVEEMFKNSNKK